LNIITVIQAKYPNYSSDIVKYPLLLSTYTYHSKGCCMIITDNKMPRVEENGIASSLHYALTDSQCSICGAQLEWKAEFNDIRSPKYMTNHCNQDYIITIDSVKVEVVKQSIENQEEKNNRQEQQQQPKAITMAEQLKDKSSLDKKTKLGDGSNIKAEDR
jgi:hypothetical protein